MTFTFDEKKHKYYLDDEMLPGVTTILGIIAGYALTVSLVEVFNW